MQPVMLAIETWMAKLFHRVDAAGVVAKRAELLDAREHHVSIRVPYCSQRHPRRQLLLQHVAI
jgi:hypothetical protein